MEFKGSQEQETALDTATGKTVMRINSKIYRPSKVELLIFSDRLPIVTIFPFNYTGRGQAPQFLIPKLVQHFACKAEEIELVKLEVERELCGDPSKIQACIGKMTFFDFMDTLKWMLKESL